MSDNKEEIGDNELDVSKLSNNAEEIEYDSKSETSLNSYFDEEDDEFQTPLVVPQEPLIPSQQQHHLHPHLFYSGCDQTKWNIRPSALPSIVQNIIRQGVFTPKGQTTEKEIESWELFFDDAMLESITDFTSIKIGLLHNIFHHDRDAKETYIVDID